MALTRDIPMSYYVWGLMVLCLHFSAQMYGFFFPTFGIFIYAPILKQNSRFVSFLTSLLHIQNIDLFYCCRILIGLGWVNWLGLLVGYCFEDKKENDGATNFANDSTLKIKLACFV